jgi:hypothetical protein
MCATIFSGGVRVNNKTERNAIEEFLVKNFTKRNREMSKITMSMVHHIKVLLGEVGDDPCTIRRNAIPTTSAGRGLYVGLSNFELGSQDPSIISLAIAGVLSSIVICGNGNVYMPHEFNKVAT